MAGDARFTISAEDRTKRGADSVKSNIKGVKKETTELEKETTKLVKSYASWAAAFVAVRKVARFMQESIDLAAKQEAITKRLALAMSRYGGAVFANTNRAQKFSNAMQTLTGVSNEQIEEVQTLLLNMGVLPSKLDEAATAALNLSAAMGVDVVSAAKQIGKTLSGMRGELGESVKGMENLDAAALKAGGAITLINEKFGGAAQQEVETYTGKVKVLSEAWDDLKKTMGEGVSESSIVSEQLQSLTTVVGVLTGALSDNERAWKAYLKQRDKATDGTVPSEILLSDFGGGTGVSPLFDLAETQGVPKPKPKKGKGKKGTPSPFIGKEAAIAFRIEEEAARASQATAQAVINEKIAAEERLQDALAGTRKELVDLRKAEDARLKLIEDTTRQQNQEAANAAQELRDEQVRESELFAAQMQGIMVSAGALAIQSLVRGMRGEQDAVRGFLRGLLGIAGGALSLLGPGGAIAGAGVSALGGLFHDGGIIRAHNGLAPGLRPGEVPIIAQTGESVLTREATASIGADRILEANRTGRMGGGGMTINITAMDAKGVSDSMRHGPLGDAFRSAAKRGRIGGPF